MHTFTYDEFDARYGKVATCRRYEGQNSLSLTDDQFALLEQQLADHRIAFGPTAEQRAQDLAKFATMLQAAALNSTAKQRVSEQQGPKLASRKPPQGRNEKCRCGSGKKFKKCHGAQHAKAIVPKSIARNIERIEKPADFTPITVNCTASDS